MGQASSIEWTDATWWPSSLLRSETTAPLRWRKPRRRTLVKAWNGGSADHDLFHEARLSEELDLVFAIMAMSPEHSFLVVTKRPGRVLWYLTPNDPSLGPQRTSRRVWNRVADLVAEGHRAVPPERANHWPLPNVWIGVSVEDQTTADERIPLLLSTPAAVRFVSYEPALGPVDFTLLVEHRGDEYGDGRIICNAMTGERWMKDGFEKDLSSTAALDQIIVGGESGPGARPCDVAWIRSTRDQCRAAGVACFVKQLGAHVTDRNDAGVEGEEPRDWPSGTETEDWTEDPARRFQGAPMRVYLRDRKGGDMAEWPEDLRVREFPTNARRQA